MEEKLERLVKWSKGRKQGPLSLELWPTNRCNLKCVMCGTWANRRKEGIDYNPYEESERELSDESMLKVVDDAANLGVKDFLISGGGEPLVRKNITLKTMRKIKSLEAYGRLNTNGTLFLPQDISNVIDLRWDLIIFSLDGPDAEAHDFIRNMPGTFEKVKKVLIEFKKQKKKMNIDKPKIVFNTVLMNKNFNKILKLIKFAGEVDCEDITFIPLITFDKYVEEYKLNLIQKLKISEMILKIEKFSEKLGIHTNLDEFKEIPIIDTSRMDDAIKTEIELLPEGFASTPCYEPFLHLLITPDGNTTCCCMLAGKGVKKDFISEGLTKIWFGDWLNNLRNQFLRKELPKECGFCVFQQFVRNKKIRKELKKMLK